MTTTKHVIDVALEKVRADLLHAEAGGAGNTLVATSDLRMVLEELERLGGIELD